MSKPQLELVVPGLLGPVTDAAAVARLQPELTTLGELLTRATVQRSGHDDALASVFAPFGCSVSEIAPAAAARAGEPDAQDRSPADRWWVRVDPVHLRVDATHARLFGGYALGLQSDESEALIARLNEFFAADGVVFEAPDPQRWYIGLEHDQDLQSYSPQRVAGRNVDAFMPSGTDARRWRAWLNEAQMLLHDAPVNREREQRGALPVNSLWPWGGGRRPALGEAPQRVWTDEPIARGLGRLAQSTVDDLPQSLADIQWGSGRTLAVYAGLHEPLVHGDIEGWLAALAAFERDWLVPLRQALRARALDSVTIEPVSGLSYRLTRGHLRRFWRRPRAWTQSLVEDK